jgi:DNA-binding ferritin-like protein (Dps family)
MGEIIQSLQTLFPGCLVEYKSVTLVMGNDGKQYDLSTLDEKLKPFMNMHNQQTNNSIIIDWT